MDDKSKEATLVKKIPCKTFLYSLDSQLTEVKVKMDVSKLPAQSSHLLRNINDSNDSSSYCQQEINVLNLCEGENPWKHLGVPDYVAVKNNNNHANKLGHKRKLDQSAGVISPQQVFASDFSSASVHTISSKSSDISASEV